MPHTGSSWLRVLTPIDRLINLDTAGTPPEPEGDPDVIVVSTHNELQELIETADWAYHRYRRLVINPTNDGRQPPWSRMTPEQRAAATDLDRAEAQLANYRARRAGVSPLINADASDQCAHLGIVR